MLKIKTIPYLMKIVSKLDLKPVVETLKTVDIFDDPDNSGAALKQLSKEKVGVLAMEVIVAITPQLGKIADDIPPLVAAYKDVSLDEAKEYDAAEVINEIIYDDAIRNFFKLALRKKAAPGA